MRQIVQARDEWKDKTVDTLTKLCLLYEEGRRVALQVQVADFMELRWRVKELEGELEKKRLQLQTLPGLVLENATLQSKVERMRTATTPIQSEWDGFFMVKDEIRTLYNKTKGVVTEVKNLKQREIE